MTATDARGRARDWVRDLAMGARFATSGGRQGWMRTLLTAVGVALGVAVLLLAAAVPEMVAARGARGDARASGDTFLPEAGKVARSASTVVSKDANTRYHEAELFGRLIKADGASPVTPPGVRELPADGEMLVSPELRRLLGSAEGRQLAGRLDARVVGTIGDEGLIGPRELAFYKGDKDLSTADGAVRTAEFGTSQEDPPLDASLLLLVVVACAVLVMPVAVFIATAVRFGGEQRDTRLAALRLVGADAAMARRVAAGESMVGALLGLLLGGWFFLLGRAFIGGIELFGFSVFPTDVAPAAGLGLLIVAGVPVTAVAVTIFALRGVAIEPLGLVRRSQQRPRRLLWRLVPPALGAALLLPLAGTITEPDSSVSELQVVGGTVLLLSGVSLLLPWLVERLVGRLRGGPVSWQLAVRRLQLSSGNSTRAVSGITIAVAGAIALQMIFAYAEASEAKDRRSSSAAAKVDVYGPAVTSAKAEALSARMERTAGVREAQGHMRTYVEAKGMEEGVSIAVGDCAVLRGLARVGDCRDGDVFIARPGERDEGESSGSAPVEADAPRPELPKPGGTVYLGDTGGVGGGKAPWRVPGSARTVPSVHDPEGGEVDGLLITPSVLHEKRLKDLTYQGVAVTDGSGQALENLRTAVFRVDPSYSLYEASSAAEEEGLGTVRRAVLAAAVAVLLLIGASMIVSTLEQLRERKRQLSVLVAFGTKRSTLGVSVLWQTAVPVALGIALAVAFGLGLGWSLLRMLGADSTDWFVFLPVAGAGAGVIAMVTLVSLPFLWRMMRPDGLRTE